MIRAVAAAHATGQPVLIGTASVEASETLARMLKMAKIPHSVLNAKYHAQEAAIVASAGQKGAVTVSTNMAGRGTDIKLGEGVAELGGLFVIATERHASRRVDRQLRGRCSRQGDPGCSQFFISLEDDLMRNHGNPTQMVALIEQSQKGGTAPIGKLVESAQNLVEQRETMSRKQVLDYDDVMNFQREIVYDFRNNVLGNEDIRDLVQQTIEEVVYPNVQSQLAHCDRHDPDFRPILRWASETFHAETSDLTNTAPNKLAAEITQRVQSHYASLLDGIPAQVLEDEERRPLLFAIDDGWQEHLAEMDELREAVFLRSQSQKDPLVEYKVEAFSLFGDLMTSIKQNAITNLFHLATRIHAMKGRG